MLQNPRCSIAVLTVAMVALHHLRADDGPLGRELLAPIREATRDLAREVEYLQDVIAQQQRGEKDRTLYGQADSVLAGIAEFQKSLKPETTRERLYKAFDELDRKLHEFLKAVQALGPEQRLLQRLAERISAADEQMHYVLSAQDRSESRAAQIVERQTRALVTAARFLDKTAAYTLGTVQARGILVADLHKLAEVTERFQKGLSGADRPHLRKDFVAVNQAWERAIRGLQELKAGENMGLLRAAGELDRLHERLFRLLGMEGDRPQLIILT